MTTGCHDITASLEIGLEPDEMPSVVMETVRTSNDCKGASTLHLSNFFLAHGLHRHTNLSIYSGVLLSQLKEFKKICIWRRHSA